jgi:hypothetical protein
MARAAKKVGRRDADLGARFTLNERARVELAMVRSGQNLTEFIRTAVLSAADQALANDPLAAFAGAIGVIDVKGPGARRSEAVYSEMLLDKHAASRRRTRRAQAER